MLKKGLCRHFSSLVVAVGLASLSYNVRSQGAGSAEQRINPQIDVRTDCGATGDGISDDSAAIQSCIDNHASHTIFFPKSKTSGRCDYKLSQTILFNSYSTMLAGDGGTANNNTTLCWTDDVTGINVTGGQGQILHNLNLRGGSVFNAVKTDTYTHGSADGIRVDGGQVTLRDVLVTGFSRHGVNVDTKKEANGDFWMFQNVRAETNRGDGFHFSGRDANAGLCLLCISRLNQGWGFYDDAVIPSTFIAPVTDANHNDPRTPSSSLTVKIDEVSVRDGIATAKTSSGHKTIVGDWGVINGCPAFHNKWHIIAVPSPIELQFRTSIKDGVYCDAGSAVYGYQPGARVWAIGRTIHDAEMKVADYNLMSSSAQWTNSDLGTTVCVEGASADGTELCSTIRVITGNIAVLTDVAMRSVRTGNARIATNGGPYNATNSTFVESYAEGNQEGLSQLANSLTLGENWGIGANPELENTVLNNGYASPIKFTRRNISGGYGRSIFQAGRAYGTGSIARDPSYEGFWNAQEMDDRGGLLASLSFRRSNVTGIPTSGWNCFTQDGGRDGAALTASSLCLPDAKTRATSRQGPASTTLPLFPGGGFWVKSTGIDDGKTSTTGVRQIRYDATTAPTTCEVGDIAYKAIPISGEYMGWICPTTNSPVPFGEIALSSDSVFSQKVVAPKLATARCKVGQWAADASYYYVCTETDVWRRTALTKW
jgi:Pectate lyase superfamily protein